MRVFQVRDARGDREAAVDLVCALCKFCLRSQHVASNISISRYTKVHSVHLVFPFFFAILSTIKCQSDLHASV